MLEAQLRPEDGDLERRRVDRVADERVGERSEEHTSELQSQSNLVCRLLLEKNNLVLMSSVWPEPFGMVAIEAMRYGLPVIALTACGIHGWLLDGHTAYPLPWMHRAPYAARA